MCYNNYALMHKTQKSTERIQRTLLVAQVLKYVYGGNSVAYAFERPHIS